MRAVARRREQSSAADTLPLQPSRLVGRRRELETILAALDDPDVRLLTLTGPPGVGKTRLAMEAAAAAAVHFSDGVTLVDLLPVRDPGLVVPTIGAALGVREGQSGFGDRAVGHHLRQRHILLVLDNFEQVAAAAPSIAGLLSTCPGVKMLVTSRARLHISWEYEHQVAPLRLPTADELASNDTLSRVPSVALFVSRARAVGAGLARDDLRLVADICARLDGLPLALELAAARARVLPLRTIAERLVRPLELLTDGPRDWPPHHTTLRAAIDWSYRLLPEPERAVFRRLGVFAGGSDLSAVAVVCAPSGSDQQDGLLRAIAVLGEHGLLAAEAAGEAHEPRIRLLETLREYALERLCEASDERSTRDRHAAHYCDIAERSIAGLAGAKQSLWLDTLNREYENLRAALHWLLDGRHPARADGLRMVAALGRFWEASGRLTEGSAWLETALEHADPAPNLARSRALNVAGNFARLRGDHAAARTAYEQSSRVAQQLGDKRGMALPLANLGNLAWDRGDHATARSAFTAAYALLCEIGDDRTAAMVQSYLGGVACDEGAYSEAIELCGAALDAFRRLEDSVGVASVLTELGEAAYAQDDLQRAMTLFQESLRLRRSLGDVHEIARSLRHVGKTAVAQRELDTARDVLSEALALFQRVEFTRGIALVLEHLGHVAILAGDARRGARVCSAASALRAQVSTVLPAADRCRSERMLNDARSRLGRRGFDAEWILGQATSLSDAIRLACADAVGSCREPRLSGRERQVADLIAEGRSNKDIADALLISQRTVEVHVSNALRKAELDSRTQLAVWAREHL